MTGIQFEAVHVRNSLDIGRKLVLRRKRSVNPDRYDVFPLVSSLFHLTANPIIALYYAIGSESVICDNDDHNLALSQVGENALLEVGLINASFIKEYIPIDTPPQLFGDLSRNPPVFVPVADKYIHTWPPAYRSRKEVEISVF